MCSPRSLKDRREAALAAIASVVHPATVTGIRPMVGAGSKASTLRVDAGSGAYVLRLEVDQRGSRSPPRSYPCLRAAAAAGIAPGVHHADAAAGLVLTDFVVERPLATFPGGEPALLRALGEMVARLQTTAVFPSVMQDFGVIVEALLNLVRDGGSLARGVLDGPVAGLVLARAEYPWADAPVSAHNDINPCNILFDGERLWLVDGELAFRNDPLADVADIAKASPRCRTSTRSSSRAGWAGRLTSTPDQFRDAIMRGELRGTPELLFVLGKMNLAGFTAQRS